MSPTENVKGSVRVPWAVVLGVAGLALGGGSATAIQRAMPDQPAIAELTKRVAGLEDRTRALEIAGSRTEAKLDAIAEALRSLDAKIERLAQKDRP